MVAATGRLARRKGWPRSGQGCSRLEAAEEHNLVGFVANEAQDHDLSAWASLAASTDALLINLSPYVHTISDMMIM